MTRTSYLDQALDAYRGREHSLVKHIVLKDYLELLLKIVGRWRPVVYVDGFAGPWKSVQPDFADTSSMTGLRTIAERRADLAAAGKAQAFGALLIEKDAAECEKLKVASGKYSDIRTTIWNSDFTACTSKIAEVLAEKEFAFVFVDPFGWSNGVVEPAVLAPLLQRKRTEVMINLMWNFIALATGHDEQKSNLEALFGPGCMDGAPTEPHARRLHFTHLYRQRLKAEASAGGVNARTALFPVEFVGKSRVFFYLVYVTQSAKGLWKFHEVAQQALAKQKVIKYIVSDRRETERSGALPLFAPEDYVTVGEVCRQEDIERAITARIPTGEGIPATEDLGADILEACGCTPAELHRACKALVDAGVLQVHPQPKGKRPVQAVHWGEGEQLVRLR